MNRPTIGIVVIVGLALVLMLVTVRSVTADNGVHGGYSITTDKCGGCHRTHSALGANLLASSVTPTNKSAFCYTCHSWGTGAYTDVKNGLMLITATVVTADEKTTVPASSRPLRGGGFEYAHMNADLNPTGALNLAVTSSHVITGGSNTVWGYGAITSTVNAGTSGVALTCTNCHNPHGGAGAGNTPTYRILKGNNSGNSPLFTSAIVTASASVDVPDPSGAKSYDIDDTNHGYPDSYFGQHGDTAGSVNTYAALSDWCAQCHTRYRALMSATPGSTSSGDAILTYRHGSNLSASTGCTACHDMHTGEYYPGCVTCHVAHGSGVRMGSYSGTVPWPEGATSPNGNTRSALLRLDSRGVCEACHNK